MKIKIIRPFKTCQILFEFRLYLTLCDCYDYYMLNRYIYVLYRTSKLVRETTNVRRVRSIPILLRIEEKLKLSIHAKLVTTLSNIELVTISIQATAPFSWPIFSKFTCKLIIVWFIVSLKPFHIFIEILVRR